MDERITNLKRKIVKLEDFFRDITDAFSDKVGLKCICFLTLDDKTLDFITAFSTRRSNIKITTKDFTPFNNALEKDIFCPRQVLWVWGLWKQIRNFKIIWKIYLYGISAIMPIKGSNGVYCLIIFCDRGIDNWINQNSEYMEEMAQHITFCLEAIRLYNQTLEGLIKKYCPSTQALNSRPIPANDDQIPSLIERKVEFL